MNERFTVKYNGWTDDIVYAIPNITYAHRKGEDLKLHIVAPIDFHYSKKEGYPITKRYPLIVFAKGSAFTSEILEKGIEFINDAFERRAE